MYENLQPSRSKSTPPEGSSPGNHVKASPSTADNLYPPGYHHVQQRAETSFDRPDGKRMNTGQGYGVTPNYVDSGYRPSNDYQGQQYPGNRDSQSQRPPPGSYSQPPPSNPHHSSQQPRYGYVHTSRSTPVTPTPQQQSQPPMGTAHRMEPRSHSPGPVRRAMAPKGVEYQNSQPQGPQNRAQYPRSDSLPNQNSHVYQNHPPSSNRGDNSYENVPTGYYYTTSPSQMPGGGHSRPHESVSSSQDYYTSSSHLNTSHDNYGPTAYRISTSGNPTRQDQRRPQQRPSQVQPVPQYSQNMPVRSNSPTKSLSSVPPSPSLAPQPNMSTSHPQFSSGRSNQMGSGQIQGRSSQPPQQPRLAEGPVYRVQVSQPRPPPGQPDDWLPSDIRPDRQDAREAHHGYYRR